MADFPSEYCRTCLLYEAGKNFEWIIASCLSTYVLGHLLHVGLGRIWPKASPISDRALEMRTVDAIMLVWIVSEQAINKGGVPLAISLDIINTFNALLWVAIRHIITSSSSCESLHAGEHQRLLAQLVHYVHDSRWFLCKLLRLFNCVSIACKWMTCWCWYSGRTSRGLKDSYNTKTDTTSHLLMVKQYYKQTKSNLECKDKL
ncbi:unnamed protein product [Euphydryas editha]|uniref:Uncharacterized protein n=1 Tax=Euphydryas editha TaxID=104508 RepID=A0AAU9UCR0_EUPED|nr:unnamed protein product [Euphydryas editha]